MRESFRKLKQLCVSTEEDSHWLSNLESTGWMDHISLLLFCSTRISVLVNRGKSILVHWYENASISFIMQALMDGIELANW